MTKLKKWTTLLCCVDVIIFIGLSLLLYFAYLHHKLDYKEYCGAEVTTSNFQGTAPYMEDIIIDINRRTGTCYNIKFVEGMNGGQTRLSSNIIEIDPFMVRETFVWVYVHEIFHHTFFTHNDRFVEFETFKFLYESDNAFYRHSAVYELRRMSSQNEQYDVRYYIYQYLEEKEGM